MTDQTYEVLALLTYLVAMMAIGLWAFRRTTDLDDYMLAGRGLGPAVSALSAGASDSPGGCCSACRAPSMPPDSWRAGSRSA